MENVRVMAIEADAEVIPGPETQMLEMLGYIRTNYGAEENTE